MKTFNIAAILAVALTAGACSVAPDAGMEGVLIEKPIIFGHGGVNNTPVKTGRSFVAPTTDYVYVTVTPLTYQEHFDDLMSSDGVPLDFDASIRLQVKDSVKLVRDFGVWANETTGNAPVWYHSNVLQTFRTLVRQEVRKHGMNETAISSAAVQQIDETVEKQLRDYITKIGLPVELIELTVGRANPPDSIKTQRTETATQEQRANTEKQRALAEEQRLFAEGKRAAADNAYRESMQLSPEQFLRLESIKMQRDVCMKGGCTFTTIGSGSVTPTYQVK